MATRLVLLIFNICRNNPVLQGMFAVPRDYDPMANDFFETEKDLFENNVHRSRFWEVVLLKRHFLSDVRTIANNLQKRSNDALDLVDLDKYSKLTLEKLLLKKLKRVKS